MRGPIALKPLGVVGGAVALLEHVQFRISVEGVCGEWVLISAHRRVEPFGKEVRPSRMSHQHNQRVSRRELRAGQVRSTTARGGRDGRLLGLLLIERGKSAAARVSDQDDLLVAFDIPEMGDDRSDIDNAVLEQQSRVVAEVPCGHRDGVDAPVRPRIQGVVAEEVR
ncbi:hypothetical protein NJ76_31360 [Rhodococcus sp. IITR03]|nr:hypothetical protein NJ76_31360 [Rhodococcus sp. IITR03]